MTGYSSHHFKAQHIWSILIALLLAALATALSWAFWAAFESSGGRLADLALEKVPLTGVSNPVTSVLLSFRAYDTLLELAVLLVALLGIWSLGPAPRGFQPAAIVLSGLAGGIVPLLILSSGYLLWVGAHAPGGAFQAGALLGAAGVMLALTGNERAGLPTLVWLRLALVLGVLVFVTVGLGTALAGLGFLTYPSAAAKWLILAIETAATLAIGATLAAAYLGGRPCSGEQRDMAP